MDTRVKRFAVRLGLLAGGLLVGLLVVEIALRIVGIAFPRNMVADEQLGFIRRPGVVFWNRDEGEALVEINSLGFRDRELPLAKEPNEYRIAVLGDSYVEAIQVPVEARFTELIQKKLQASKEFADKRVEVMNFGMSGFGTAQELLLLRNLVWDYQPDLVVIGFLTGNDFRNNHRPLLPESTRPYFELVDGQLVLDDRFLETVQNEQAWSRRAVFVVADNSRIVQVLYRVLRNMRARAAEGANTKELATEVGLDDEMYAPPSTPDWKQAWAVTEVLLKEIADETRAHGAELLVVSFTNADQIHPDPRHRTEYAKRVQATDLFYPDDRIAECGKRDGYPVLVLARPMVEHAERTGEYLHGFENVALGRGHWNEAGHELAAELIADQILQMHAGSQPDSAAPAPAAEPAKAS